MTFFPMQGKCPHCGRDDCMPELTTLNHRIAELEAQLAECQRELHLIKADDPEGTAFGEMVLRVIKERDALREENKRIEVSRKRMREFIIQTRSKYPKIADEIDILTLTATKGE